MSPWISVQILYGESSVIFRIRNKNVPVCLSQWSMIFCIKSRLYVPAVYIVCVLCVMCVMCVLCDVCCV